MSDRAEYVAEHDWRKVPHQYVQIPRSWGEFCCKLCRLARAAAVHIDGSNAVGADLLGQEVEPDCDDDGHPVPALRDPRSQAHQHLDHARDYIDGTMP